MGGEMTVVVTVAAMFLVPAALGRRGSTAWPRGDLGAALDGALLVALCVMCLSVASILFSS